MDNEVYTILTKRSSKVSSHRGEICFPGGKEDKEDKDVIDTALREAVEEVGISASYIHVIGKLAPVVSRGRLLVTPIVGLLKNIDEIQIKLNKFEVEEIFACPLSIFNNHSIYFNGKGFEYSPYLYSQNFLSKVHNKNDFLKRTLTNTKPGKYVIWGMTAYFAIIIADICLHYDSSSKLQHAYATYYKKWLNTFVNSLQKNKL